METPVDLDRVEALLFDFGNVVVDIDFGRCTAHWAALSGRDQDDITERFRFDQAYCDHERGLIDIGTYLDHLRVVLDVELTDDELLEGWNGIFVGPTPGVAEILVAAGERWPLHGFTNTNPTHRAEWAPRFDADLSVFESIFCSHELGERKPDRAAFDLVAAEMGVAPDGILFFDDTAENVDGARTAGLQAVLVSGASSIAEALAG